MTDEQNRRIMAARKVYQQCKLDLQAAEDVMALNEQQCVVGKDRRRPYRQEIARCRTALEKARQELSASLEDVDWRPST